MNYYDEFLETENLKIYMTSLELHINIALKFKDMSNYEELKVLYTGTLEAFESAYNQVLKYTRGWAMKYVNTKPVDASTKIKILSIVLKGNPMTNIENISTFTKQEMGVCDLNMINELCEKASEFLNYTQAFVSKLNQKS